MPRANARGILCTYNVKKLHLAAHWHRLRRAISAVLLVSEDLVESRETDQDIDNLGNSRAHASEEHSDIPIKQTNKEPIQSADN